MEIGEVYYSASSQWILNIVLASMILGVALDIHWRDFKAIVKMPKAILAGLGAQFVALPAITTGLTLLLDLDAGIELGMILVAACPGGAISNFVTHLAKGNTALSISMTAAASTLATVMLPLNFIFWSQVNPDTAALIHTIDVSTSSLMTTLFWVLALPLVTGLLLQQYRPALANLLHKLLKVTSTLALLAFIIVAIVQNHRAFLTHLELIFIVVLIHNSLAYLLGFMAGKLTGLGPRDIKATTIEVGMQNSSLAIAIVFSQFHGEAGMALISAFWGTWHIASGLLLVLIFNRWERNPAQACVETSS